MPISVSPEWGTIADAANRLKVSPQTIRRMVKKGTIRAERFSTRLIRIDLNSLERRKRPTAAHEIAAAFPPLSDEQVAAVVAVLRGGGAR